MPDEFGKIYGILEKAMARTDAIGVVCGSKPKRDDYGIAFAWPATYRNGTRTYLLGASHMRMEPGRGYSKSIDAELIDQAVNERTRITLWIEDTDTFYDLAPSTIQTVMRLYPDNRQKVTRGSGCLLCSGFLSPTHHCNDHGTDRYETYRGRLKYRLVPLAKSNARNLSAARERPMSETESILNDAFIRAGLKLSYTGNREDAARLYGWKADWSFGPWTVEYDGTSHTKADRDTRKTLAMEHNCEPPHFITDTTSSIRTNPLVVRRIVNEVAEYLGIHQRRLDVV